MFRKYYLAYGSNLNINNMMNMCPNSTLVGTTIIFNYRLVFKGSIDGNAYLTIEPFEGAYVPLGIYSITLSSEKKLDMYESVPNLYHKQYIILNIKGKKIPGLIYVMNDEFKYCLPNKHYVDTCIKGYKDFGFNTNLLKKALLDTTNKKCHKK